MGRWRQSLHTKECLERPEVQDAREDYSLVAPKGTWPCPNLDFRLLTLRTVRESISAVCGFLFFFVVATGNKYTHYKK